MDIRKITINDKLYPKEFTAIGGDKPQVIYAMGNIDLLLAEHKVAVIGARNCDNNGSKAAYKLGREYASKGWIIVSGLALGCDSAAHRGCLSVDGGKTIAIVATGLDITHPKENVALQDEILTKGGLLLSEQSLGAHANPTRLVARNRLQAALSELVIVAQCPVKSGTMHTVRFAQKYNKEVRAVEFYSRNEYNSGNWNLIEVEGVEPIK